MKRMKWIASVATGVLAGGLAWAVAAAAPDSYVKVDAASLVRAPQNAWARAILFSDVMESPPSGRTRRLDRRNYLKMRLKNAGTVWVPEDLAPKFQALDVGQTYSFAGTVDQISRRYYVIVDACYAVQTLTDMTEHWIDMLDPETRPGDSKEDLSATFMQALLLDAQNSLIKMAEENNLTVAQLIEGQSDGGQRIAEHIVADALQGKLRAQGQTADELMIGAVLALLQKQAVLQESARLAEAEAAAAPEPTPEVADVPPMDVAAVQEESDAAPVEGPADESPPPLPEAAQEETGVVLAETPAETGEVDPPEAPAPELAIEEPAAVAEESAPVPLIGEALAEAPEVVEAPAAVAEEPAPVPEIEEALAEPTEEAIPVAEPEAMDLAANLPGEPPAAVIEEATEEPETPKKKPRSRRKKQPEAEVVDAPVAVEETAPDADVMAEAPRPEDGEAGTLEFVPGPTLEEEWASAQPADLILPGDRGEEPGPVAAPPSSMLVGPMTDVSPDVVPMVSTEPTKAELAQLEKEEAAQKQEEARLARIEAKRIAAEEKKAAREETLRLREEKRQARAEARRQAAEAKRIAAEEKKAAAEALAQQREAERLAKIEADRIAAAEKAAAAEARKAELARRKAEEKQAREEEAARKAAEWKAQQEAALAEAEAKKALQEKERLLAQQEKEALEAVRQAERMAKQEEEARRQREETEQRLAELEARKAAAEAAMREAEAKQQAELQRIQEEAEAKAAAEAAEREARLAEERARKAEALRIAQEVTDHELQAVEVSSQRIAEEVAARQAAEERLRQMEREIRDMEARVRQAEAGRGSPASTVPAGDQTDLSVRESRQQEADAPPAAPVDPGDLPEWMQPVRF